MPQLETLAPDAPAEEINRVLVRDGALIICDLVDPATMDAFWAEAEPYVLATQPGRDAFTGVKTTRTGALVARSETFRDLMMNPVIQAQCEAVLKPNCDIWQLHLGQVIRIMPGQVEQSIHRDRWAWGTYLKGIEPQLNTIWAVTDFTQANGATQVVPGSVDWPDDRRATPEEIGYAEMSKGSVLVYTGTVFHGGGANRTQADRVGLNLTYTLGWLRQEENQYLSCPPEIARTLSPEQQAMIGYAMGSYALGYYTPPLPPGQGPEVVPPQFALTGQGDGSGFGSQDNLAALRDQIRS